MEVLLPIVAKVAMKIMMQNKNGELKGALKGPRGPGDSRGGLIPWAAVMAEPAEART